MSSCSYDVLQVTPGKIMQVLKFHFTSVLTLAAPSEMEEPNLFLQHICEHRYLEEGQEGAASQMNETPANVVA